MYREKVRDFVCERDRERGRHLELLGLSDDLDLLLREVSRSVLPLAPWLRVEGGGFRVEGGGFRVQGGGFSFRVQGSGFRVQGAGCRVVA